MRRCRRPCRAGCAAPSPQQQATPGGRSKAVGPRRACGDGRPPDHGLDPRPAPQAACVGPQQPGTVPCHPSLEKEERMTWQIWDEHRDHGHVRAGSLRRGWAACLQVEHTAWPRATRAGRGLLLALGGVWGLHGQEGHAASAATHMWTQAQPLPYLQAVALGLLSWCAAVLVVATGFLGLLLLAAWIQQRYSRRHSAAALERAWTPSLARPPQV